MKQYIKNWMVAGVIMSPFIFASFQYQNNPIAASSILIAGFVVSVVPYFIRNQNQ